MRKRIEIQENKIIFDKDFFDRIFIRSSVVNKKAFGSTTFRVMAILLQELDMHKEGRIPPRIELAEKLGVSTTSINDSLKELEDAGFLERYINKGLEEMIVVEESRKDHQRLLTTMEKEKEVNRGAKRFSDYFTINYFFNQTASEIAIESYEELEKFIRKDLKDEELTELLKGWNYEQAIIEEIIKIYNEKNN